MDKKKLVIYTSFPYWPRLETELEIADFHINQGYDVLLLSCMGGLVTCPENVTHRKLKCLSCTSRLHAGYKWLGKDRATLKRMYCVTREQQAIIDQLMAQPFNSWEDLRAIMLDGDDVGEAAFSELVSHFRETGPELNKKNTIFARRLLENAIITHFSILNHLKAENPDRFILYNGRIAAYRPALRVGVSLGMDTNVFEVLSTYGKYILTRNTYPHNPIAMGRQFRSLYDESTKNEEEKFKIASEWFIRRIAGDSVSEYIFTQKQKRGYGLEDLKNITKIKVGIFISSEEELLAIPEHKSPYYTDQNSAIAKIADDLRNEKIIFIVRAHPHLIGVYNTQVKGLREVCSSRNNIKYFPPASKVSTYELIDLCDVILVFGSTVGIEAVYKRKPTILMGMAAYRGFGGTIEPESHEDLVKILKESADCGYFPKHLIPSDQAMHHAAIMYAFGLHEFGIMQEYQQSTSFHKIFWIEKDGIRTYIRPHWIYRVTDFLYRIVTIPRRQYYRFCTKFRMKYGQKI